MRQTKFRALKTIQTSRKKNEHNSDDFIYSNGYYFDGYNYWFIIPKEDKNVNISAAIAYAEHKIINIETLGQFISHHDKNKTEIYEGDILQIEDSFSDDDSCHNAGYEPHGTVVYKNDGFMVESEDEGFYDNMGIIFSWNESKIIGNVHQTPKLKQRKLKL